MKNRLFTALLLLICALSAFAGANDFYMLPNLKDDWRVTLGLPCGVDRPCVIDFGATWCMPCQQFAPTYEKCARQYSGRIDMASCDCDKQRIIASNYRIQVMPTIILFDSTGKPFKRFEAAPMEKEFIAALEELLAFSGCEEGAVEESVEVYYTLDGREVVNPERGIYIQRKAGQSRLVRF